MVAVERSRSGQILENRQWKWLKMLGEIVVVRGDEGMGVSRMEVSFLAGQKEGSFIGTSMQPPVWNDCV